MVEKQGFYSIGNVERDTGIGRDTLRIWERRYGFPEPLRNTKGERVYSESQLRRLQRVRRLLDQGMRPGKLLILGEAALNEIEANLLPQSSALQDETIKVIIDCICSADVGQLQLLLRSQYQKQGMQEFIVQTVTPLLTTIGELWATGRLQIFQEHFLSQQLSKFLNAEIAQLQKDVTTPKILLATLPGEEHTLGLLMLVALLAARDINAISLGSEVPMDQIAQAVKQFQADTVGITFSGAYQYKNIRDDLLQMRDLLPDDVGIWVGGEGVRRLRKLPVGIIKFNSFEQLPYDVF